jgi:hypothetical protein
MGNGRPMGEVECRLQLAVRGRPFLRPTDFEDLRVWHAHSGVFGVVGAEKHGFAESRLAARLRV